MATAPLPPLIHRPPPQPRQRKRALQLGGGLVVLLVVGLAFWTSMGDEPIPPRELRDRPPSEQAVVENASGPPEDLTLPTSYLRRRAASLPPESPPAAPPPLTPDGPAIAQMSLPGGTPQDLRAPAFGGSLPPTTPSGPGTPQGKPATGGGGKKTGPLVTSATTPKESPRWFSRKAEPQGDVLAPPLPDDPREAEAQARGSHLFPKAVWETPADPYKVLYADQLVQGQLSRGVNSDVPGLVLVKTTEPVMDRWGHGHELIPVDSVFVGRQQGNASFGQERLPAEIFMAIFPNGTAVSWQRGQVADATGAAGIPANVDNHYLKLFLGVGLQAVLNIGVRVPFGSTSGFQPHLGQEFAQEATQGINQAGQRLLSQFNIRPTLTQEHAYPVTIAFGENVSFQTQPLTVRK